jgi:hypothetical protein
LPREWTNEKVKESILARHASGKDMSQAAIRKDDMGLSLAASRRFGGWYKALEAAGITPEEHMRQKPSGFWNENRILDEIRRLHQEKKPLYARYATTHYGPLFSAAWKRYGTWEKAIETAGIAYDEIRSHRKWSKESVISEIRNRQSRGLPLSSLAVKKDDTRLWDAARAYFGDWYSALGATGIERSRITRFEKWSPERVTTEIQKLVSLDEDLSLRNVFFKYSKLYNAACRYFGTWEASLKECRLDYDEIRRQRRPLTENEILAELRSILRSGSNLDWTSVREVDASLAKTAREQFGTYRAAIGALGLDYERVKREELKMARIGKEFENCVKESLISLGWNLVFQKRFRFGSETCMPDFVDLNSGAWIDAKLDTRSPWVLETIDKYLRHSDKVIIVHLKGRQLNLRDKRVEFIPAKTLYADLKRQGRRALIRRMEELRNGRTLSRNQSKLSKYA